MTGLERQVSETPSRPAWSRRVGGTGPWLQPQDAALGSREGCPSTPALCWEEAGLEALRPVRDSPVSRLWLVLNSFREASCLTTHV